jgi:hypothetical protein
MDLKCVSSWETSSNWKCMIKENKKDERLKNGTNHGYKVYVQWTFGIIVSLLNVKPNCEKVIYLSFYSFIHLFLACYLC